MACKRREGWQKLMQYAEANGRRLHKAAAAIVIKLHDVSV